MSFPLLPALVYKSVLDIDGAQLAQRGITLLLADLDNTLTSYGTPLPDEELVAWKDRLKVNGVDLYLLSNSRRPNRPRIFAEGLGIPYLGHAGKPMKKGFLQALAEMERTPSETAMVGDQIFTDILGANRMGILPILVEPIKLAGNPGRYVRYAVETPFRQRGYRNTEAEKDVVK